MPGAAAPPLGTAPGGSPGSHNRLRGGLGPGGLKPGAVPGPSRPLGGGPRRPLPSQPAGGRTNSPLRIVRPRATFGRPRAEAAAPPPAALRLPGPGPGPGSGSALRVPGRCRPARRAWPIGRLRSAPGTRRRGGRRFLRLSGGRRPPRPAASPPSGVAAVAAGEGRAVPGPGPAAESGDGGARLPPRFLCLIAFFPPSPPVQLSAFVRIPLAEIGPYGKPKFFAISRLARSRRRTLCPQQ